jgi:dTDP-4-dehydrorhamnose reductase
MKKILITGGNGQLGNCLQKISLKFKDRYEFNFTDTNSLNITNTEDISRFFDIYKPDFCINTAAYTAVDLAETEKKKAFEINTQGVKNLAEAAVKNNCTLIQISTDYVFDGETNVPYTEEDITNPKGIYALSKRKGEEIALEINPKTIIIRTSWLYSEFNKNFLKTMLNLFSIKDELGIVSDQFGQPTNANDLAEAIMKIIETELKIFGIFHFSNYPETTWFYFAKKIAELSGSKIKLNAITTEQFPTPAKRPKRSTMSLDKITKIYGIKPKHWENSLKKCIKILSEN